MEVGKIELQGQIFSRSWCLT